MSCFAAIILTSSCTPDSPLDTAKENQIAPTKVSSPKTEIFADGISDPFMPPKP